MTHADEQHLDASGAPRSPGYAATTRENASADPKGWSATHEVFGMLKRVFGTAILPL